MPTLEERTRRLEDEHLTLEPRIALDGDRASVVSYLAFLVDSEEEGPLIRSYGTNIDVLVRCDDGRWRLLERRPQVEARRP